jgi:hypothetical protein
VRILITGSRTWRDSALVWWALDQALNMWERPDGLTVVHGAAKDGADAHAHEWVQRRLQAGAPVTEEPHPAAWDGPLGKAAGFARNGQMVDLGADYCLTFIERCGCTRRPGPHGTHGSVDCATKAAEAGIPVKHIRPRPRLDGVIVCSRNSRSRSRT